MSALVSRQHLRERQVEQVVKKHPECLDSYRNLLIWYWVEVDKAIKYDPHTATFSLATWNIYRLSSPEAISRALRRLIESKRIVIDKENRVWRDREERHYREAHSRKEEKRR